MTKQKKKLIFGSLGAFLMILSVYTLCYGSHLTHESKDICYDQTAAKELKKVGAKMVTVPSEKDLVTCSKIRVPKDFTTSDIREGYVEYGERYLRQCCDYNLSN